MKRIFVLFCFALSISSVASAQNTARQQVDPATATVQRFETLTDRLLTAFTTHDEHNLIANEQAVLGAMREELERSEASNSSALAQQRQIFAAFENFSFYQAKPADAEEHFKLLEEFLDTMQK